MYNIRKGLDLPITGIPDQNTIEQFATPTVALIGHDYHNLKPQMLVQVGDKVKIGQPLLCNKANPDVVFTSPGCGRVEAVNRGVKRSLQSVVVRLEGKQQQINLDYKISNTSDARALLIASGLWTALRTRPFSLVPQPDVQPQAVFVTAIDTNPLAVDPEPVICARLDDFVAGIKALSRVFDCRVFVCHKDGAQLPQVDAKGVRYERFAGKHPAGNVGTHMHLLAPVDASRVNLHLHYQDVLAIGRLFAAGEIDTSRVISLAGPQVKEARLFRTNRGADIQSLVRGQLEGNDNRILSGSVFNGRRAEGGFAWLGCYHLQVVALAEGRERIFLHYMRAGSKRFSVMPIYLSSLFNKAVAFTTSTHGSERAMVPIGAYERVMPFHFLPTQLLRSLIVRDIEMAEKLGCLELDEEDLALCTFVCPGKYEYAPILRENLTMIQKEG